MCTTPKILYIKSKSDNRFRIIVPCGKCRECQNSLRAGLVARFKNEQKYLPYVKLVTLTYTDINMLNLYYKPYKFVSFDGIEFKNRLLKKLQSDEEKDVFHRYKHFLLNKEHAKTFVSEFQKRYEDKFGCKVKYYLCGEYGTLSDRPHFHIAIFFQYFHTDKMLHEFITNSWRYGEVQIGDCTDGGLNYVAKHCYKQDAGSKVQQKLAPIFHLQSKYHGGIGCNLVKDYSILYNNENGNKFGIIKGTPYKYSFPRYVRKKLFPNGYSDCTLGNLESDSDKNLRDKMLTDGYTPSSDALEVDEEFWKYYKNNLRTDSIKKNRYNLTYFNKKYLAHRKKVSIFVTTKRKNGDY